uniref:Galactosylgalactosylxylosylprotein 3-beta-glucuronosyltransferase n=1 Tax=Loa loa TaxID=7209 RepID=A0A1I7VKW0_LOALO
MQHFNYQNSSNRTIIVITPTYLRLARLADMTRLSQTLMHVSQLIWIIVEDAIHVSLSVKQLLDRSGLEYYYLAVKRRPGIPARGWTGRDAGLNFVRKRFASMGNKAVVYFADDDNAYDVRLFNRYIRNVEKIGVWAVGLVAYNAVEAPKVLNEKVVGWQTIYAPKRKWGFDMAGFAVNLELLLQHPKAGWGRKCREHSPEPCLMNHLNVSWNDLTPFGVDSWPRDILVWHTKTIVNIRNTNTYGYNAEVSLKLKKF